MGSVGRAFRVLWCCSVSDAGADRCWCRWPSGAMVDLEHRHAGLYGVELGRNLLQPIGEGGSGMARVAVGR